MFIYTIYILNDHQAKVNKYEQIPSDESQKFKAIFLT